MLEAVAENPNTLCVIIHDVDRLPKSVVDYTYCDRPTQLNSENDQWGGSVPYDSYAGGVVAMSVSHWFQINGMPNDYSGWGGEDDDLFHRLRMNSLLDDKSKMIRRPQKGQGSFMEMHKENPHLRPTGDYQNNLRLLDEMKRGSNRWMKDGLNSIHYTITDYHHNGVIRFLKVKTKSTC
mmetsp:Transcript_17064/g.38398  ORF Transcript_17064/g.38398 Transcript_17064/m.38398 type:complete len:179 (-) Transcript_17064:126-662(-)